MSHFSSHTHSRPSHISSLSFATLTHSRSHRRPKLCHCWSVLFSSKLYIYIYILYLVWDVCFVWIPFAEQRYEESHDIIAKYPNRVPFAEQRYVFYFFFSKTHQFLFCWFILFLYPNQVPVFIKEGFCWLILWVLSACF